MSAENSNNRVTIAGGEKGQIGWFRETKIHVLCITDTVPGIRTNPLAKTKKNLFLHFCFNFIF
jgi:hypothetical protein